MVRKGSNPSQGSVVITVSMIFVVGSGKKCQSSKQRRELTSEFSNSFEKPPFICYGHGEGNSPTES